MKQMSSLSFGAALIATAVMQGLSFGQMNQPLRTPAAIYFSGQSAANSMSQYQAAAPGVRGQLPAPQRVELTGSKPFHHIQHQPTLSPYLGLDMIESDTSLPNYYAYVQPQIQQRAANEAQERELERLRQQVRVATARGVVSKNPTPSVPTTGSSMQFMNVGSYFPTTR